MVNSIEDIKKFISDTNFKKIFILCGKKSFTTSGAEKFFKKDINTKVIKFFYKNSDLPILEELIEIQDRLFTIGSHLANDKKKNKIKLPEIHEKDVKRLEIEIDKMDEHLPTMNAFILPGGNTIVSYTHIARCVCRRAERQVVRLNDNWEISPIIIKYLNRLSDYLFILGRKLSKDLGADEIEWKPRN